MKRVFAVLTMAIFGFNGSAQNLPANHDRIIQLVDSRDYRAAIGELQGLQTSNAAAFIAGNYDYLLGRIAETDGRLGLAISGYQSVASRDSELRDYALKHMSAIARSTGNLMLERIYLNEILILSPAGLVAGGAAYRLARNAFETGNYVETIRLLNSDGVTQPKSGGQVADNKYLRENRTLLGEAHLRAGQMEPARGIFTGLIESDASPNQPDDFSLAAVTALDLMDRGDVANGPDLAESEHLRRAGIYQFNRDFSSARLHFEALVNKYNAGPHTPDALFQIGRGYAQQSNFAEALKWFERLLERHPQSVAAKEGLLNAASAYARVGKSKEAISRYQAFIERYPRDEKRDRAFLNIVDVYRDQDSDTEALNWCAKTREEFAGKLPASLALFAEARIFISKEDWQSVLVRLEQLKSIPNLGGVAVPGGTSKAEVEFLRAFALEQSKRYTEAIDAYLSIPDGRAEYYGWRATLRLKSLSNDETARSFISQRMGLLSSKLENKDPGEVRAAAQSLLRLTDVPTLRERAFGALMSSMGALPGHRPVSKVRPSQRGPGRQSIGDRLLSLGLYDEAAPELDSVRPASPDELVRARWHTRGGRADRGMAYIEPIWRKVESDYPIGLIPREHAELLYPAPFADELLRHASERGVDPRLGLAIMLQESRFQPDAKSYAAARGLMQFISETAGGVAGEVGRDNFAQDELYYPPTAILFGSQYLAGLFKTFPNQPDAVAASYNGGDDNMKRWLKRSRSNLPERYVPEIAYAQTKDYVYKVMANYRMYKHFYDSELRWIGGQSSP